MFPIEPRQDELDSRGLFLCQDSILRSKVLPLFRFNPESAHERPFGHGTAFRIDPWSRCATAFHVVQDLFRVDPQNQSALILRDDLRLAALQIDGVGYGRYRIPPNAWRPIADAYSVCSVESPPFQPPRLRNATELMMLQIQASSPGHAPYLNLDLTRWHPRVGERVMALGYGDLDVDGDNSSEDRPLSQYLYGSIATIIDVERADGTRGRPWPQFRVETNWPGGMSGGPVFNEDGHVIGVVSTGIEHQGVAAATYFSGWSMPQRIFPSLDPRNPGWFQCYAVFDGNGAIVRCGEDRAALETFVHGGNLNNVGAISLNFATGDFIRILNRPIVVPRRHAARA
jgi:serine protease Do